jgi:hypothetical protein
VLALALATALALGPSSTATQLTITVWPDGGADSTTWTLRCDPDGGTLPRSARACRTLAALESPFAPIPPDTACIQVYGGPQRALVRGTYRGRRIWTRFARRNGCETSRWNRHAALFPVAS